MNAEAPLTAEAAVRIAAAMVCQITQALRPDRAFPPTDRDMICAIGRMAGVHLPEIVEDDASLAAWIEEAKAEDIREKRNLAPATHRQSAEESA